MIENGYMLQSCHYYTDIKEMKVVIDLLWKMEVFER